MRFKMGKNGHYAIWVDGDFKTLVRQPIGYKTADNPFVANPITDMAKMYIAKSCSVRFGLYQGYGASDATLQRPYEKTTVLYKRIAVGPSYEAVSE